MEKKNEIRIFFRKIVNADFFRWIKLELKDCLQLKKIKKKKHTPRT